MKQKQLVCIVCPNGCRLTVTEDGQGIHVTGTRCPRGVDFATTELTHPMRTISSTVKTVYQNCPVLPVRVSGPIPKERIFDVMAQINHVLIKERVGRGAVIISDVCGLGVDVISTSNMLQ